MVSVSVILFESDFISHTFNLNTCCIYRESETSRLFEGVRARSSSNLTPIHYSIYQWLLIQTAAKPSPSTNLKYSVALSLSLLPAFSVSPARAAQSQSVHARMHKCVCECDDLNLALQCECDDLFQALQTKYVRTPRSNRTSPVRRLFASRFGARQLYI